MRSLKEIKKRAAKAAAAAFLLLGAVGVVSYASEADTAKTPFVLTFNTSTTGVFPRGVSYEGISLEGKTLEEIAHLVGKKYIEYYRERYEAWTRGRAEPKMNDTKNTLNFLKVGIAKGEINLEDIILT